MAMTRWMLMILVAALSAGPALGQILLAGGALPVCSSMAADRCSDDIAFSDDALTGHRFRLDAAAIEAWQASLPDGDPAHAWRAVLEELLASAGAGPYSRAELTSIIRSHRSTADPGVPEASRRLSGEELFQRTDDRDWWRLLDHLQEPIKNGEQVLLHHSRSEAAVEVFEHFVAMAAKASGNERPRIAFSTASSRDPYDAVDFYAQVFEQAGADAVWLPLDRAVTAARAAGSCARLSEFQADLLGSWDRARVHPTAYAQQSALCAKPAASLQLVEDIDALFLNGGDQWLTLHAFRDGQGRATPEWRRVMERLGAGEMVLGGTSAGAAVQSGNIMVSNGSSARALLRGAREHPPPAPGCDRSDRCPDGLQVDDLTFHRGGLGSFPPGIVDTHFSERWRQFRLLQLMSDTETRLGLGVDETSAIAVSGLFEETPVILHAVGQSGGWLIDLGSAHRVRQRPLKVAGARLHRLDAGTRLVLDDLDPDPGLPPGGVDETTGEACVRSTDFASFRALADSFLPEPANGAVCVEFDLDERTRAISRFKERPENAAMHSAIRSWSWSVTVQARP